MPKYLPVSISEFFPPDKVEIQVFESTKRKTAEDLEGDAGKYCQEVLVNIRVRGMAIRRVREILSEVLGGYKGNITNRDNPKRPRLTTKNSQGQASRKD